MHDAPILAHRGYSAKFPENTFRAFQAALEHGAAGIELDVQKTSDGEFAVIHDADLVRVFGEHRKIGEVKMADLVSDHGEKDLSVPRLDLLLEELKPYASSGTIINVELKSETITSDDFPRLNALLTPWKGAYLFVISAFNHRLLVDFASSGYRVGMLVGEEHRKGGISALAAAIRQIRPFSIHLPRQIFHELGGFTRWLLFFYLRLHSVKIVFWTVNSRDEFARLSRLSWAVISDYPRKDLLEHP